MKLKTIDHTRPWFNPGRDSGAHEPLQRHGEAPRRSGDVVSYRFPLFSGFPAHTSVCGQRMWRAVADPRHGMARFDHKDPRTRATPQSHMLPLSVSLHLLEDRVTRFSFICYHEYTQR
ncbi:hypothetical protein E2C01_007500 [Portunus trituberculatus]|uniref:Uncharacterized protein n=1 Tax=Portunus trituberculatus TaxID=210409 RepID=A0A5B7CZE4_PORTR|nr:hypothetical protein [Portunus trituberculatus]